MDTHGKLLTIARQSRKVFAKEVAKMSNQLNIKNNQSEAWI